MMKTGPLRVSPWCLYHSVPGGCGPMGTMFIRLSTIVLWTVVIIMVVKKLCGKFEFTPSVLCAFLCFCTRIDFYYMRRVRKRFCRIFYSRSGDLNIYIIIYQCGESNENSQLYFMHVICDLIHYRWWVIFLRIKLYSNDINLFHLMGL